MKKTIAMLLTAALSASLLSGCVTKVSDETAASSAETEAAASDSASAEETTQAESSGETDSESAAGSANLADGSYTIGIGQFAEHGSLDNCREGFLQGLAEEGFVEGENLTVLYQNAQADGANSSQIATNFVGRNVDLICAIATPMAQSAYSAAMETEIPVIYTAVTDPVAAELATEDGAPVGNITGTSDELPVKAQLEMIRQILPEAKTIGIMYTTSEVNSESTIAQYKELAPDYGFEIVETGISSSADVSLAADSLLTQVDCMTNLTDNTVVASLPVILDKANALNIPVFGSEIEQVRIGCLAAMGLDYIELGKQTGHMAAQVLKGEAEASQMNYEVIEEAAFYGNSKVAENLGITLPEELTSQAVELFDDIAQ
ncbi:MAG TPA: ABC transporter substrate-binding protein [Candidatus Enterocloster excrementigallinarum]|uniref:ABC transporter substrate-binding protein n=1 Tax=Candidatus Enterocloster excrementigallinarum TaxID=2838558 RepID=A0A9D2TGE5_9FIRM|nr:ABC transporter substrate-binding protein [Candidatus Enterocloster excrementigallinarum]